MSKFTGFSFKTKVSEDGEITAIANAGVKVRPHRITLIKAALARSDSREQLEDMFWNFHLPDCDTASNADQIAEEIFLYEAWSKAA